MSLGLRILVLVTIAIVIVKFTACAKLEIVHIASGQLPSVTQLYGEKSSNTLLTTRVTASINSMFATEAYTKTV
jgi:hypothetical protein